jgi:hypothetical protein
VAIQVVTIAITAMMAATSTMAVGQSIGLSSGARFAARLPFDPLRLPEPEVTTDWI